MRYGHRSEKAESLEEVYTMSRSEGFGKEVKNRIMLGTFVLSSGYYDAYYEKAMRARQKVRSFFDELLKDYDAIAMPTSPQRLLPKSHRMPTEWNNTMQIFLL